MVKRTPTPPPPEDEPRYLVVVHPYPLNANLLIHTDRRTLALWLACCTGKDALYALYYKPASPGMVIIEVDRYFDRFDSLLGKHAWSAFLKHPTEEDADKASKIFWCLYNSGRLVQKNGWKRVDVEEHWFTGWSPNNDVIKHPYPKTTYCDVPAEAQTGVPLCRPLPRETFPPPPPRPRPTVGSPEWVQARSNVSSVPPSSSRRRRGNHGSIAPSDSVSVYAESGIEALPPPPGPHLVRWVAEQRDQHVRRPVFATPPSTVGSDFSLSSSTASSSVGSRTRSALGATSAVAPPPSRLSVPPRPPGLPSPSVDPYEGLDWSEQVEISIEARGDAPTSPQSAGTSTTRVPGGRTAPPRRAPEPEGAIDPDQNYEYEEEDIPKRSTGDAMKAIFDGAPVVVTNDAGLHNLEEEEEEDNYVAWHYPEAVGTTARDWTAGGEGEGEDEVDPKNPWEGYDAPRWEYPTKVNIKGGEEWKCPEHGPTCNPGICKLRARVEYDRRREKELDERLEAKRRREEKWKRAAERKERKRAPAEGREVHDLPPHLTGYRGAGGSGSGSDSDSGSSSELSDSPTGSRNPSPPRSPHDNAADADGLAGGGSLWDDGDKAPPKVSLPSGSGRSASGSEAIGVGGPRTAGSTTNPNGNNSTTHQPTPRSPVPGPRQPAWGTRGTAIPPTTISARGRAPSSSQWPTPGQPHSGSNTRSTASAWTSSSTLSDNRSTGGRSSAFHPVDGGFPTFAGTTWGDPIAVAQSGRKSKKSTSASGTSSAGDNNITDGQADERRNPEAGQERQNDRTGRGRRGNRRGGGRGATRRTATSPPAASITSQEVAPSNKVLDVTLPPAGPGSQWCNGDVEW